VTALLVEFRILSRIVFIGAALDRSLHAFDIETGDHVVAFRLRK